MNASVGQRAGAALLVLACLVIGFFGGVYAEQAYPDQFPFVAKHSVGQVDTTELQAALQIIRANYVDSNLDSSKLSNGTVKGLIEGLNDPYSYYLDPTQWKRLQDSYNSRYTGIGVYIQYGSDYPLITGTVKGSPAQKAGLKSGDRIVSAGGKDLKAASQDQSAAAIGGAAGTSVTLVISRNGNLMTFTITRAVIITPSVESTIIGNHILYVRIFMFTTEVPVDFAAALSSGLSGAKGVVLDLRENGGGFVDDAADVVSEFVTSGEVVELRDRSQNVQRKDVLSTHTESTGNITEQLAPKIPLVVLVNADSASASEIVAGSLQVYGRAKLVGVKTYGKGSVQQDFGLPDGADMHLTVQRWYLSNGRTIDHMGLEPDVNVPMPSDAGMYEIDDQGAKYTDDPQLTAALKQLPS
jgi:carboxyl-terminal processing protease